MTLMEWRLNLLCVCNYSLRAIAQRINILKTFKLPYDIVHNNHDNIILILAIILYNIMYESNTI